MRDCGRRMPPAARCLSREELAALRVALPQRNTSVVVRYEASDGGS